MKRAMNIWVVGGDQRQAALAGLLASQKVDVLICGGIGGGAQSALTEAGIRFYGGVSGSADAAEMLLYLERRSPCPLGRERLHSLAARIGADVPFFLEKEPCLVEGIGERLTPLPPESLWLAPLAGAALSRRPCEYGLGLCRMG